MNTHRAHIINEDDSEHLYELFSKIKSGNSILLLGAGASVTNKIFLSSQLITYYEDKVGESYNIPDITKFLDVLESIPTFDRNQFDEAVSDLLKKLDVSEHHKIIASTPWRQILTTNYDLLLEKAYEEIKNTSNHQFDIFPIRNLKEYNSSYEANDEIRYVKLNGCLSDKSKYQFAFSTEDFKVLKKYHKKVLQNLSNPSPKITFISAGYSYSDTFGYKFFDSFDKSESRNRRWIYNIDPYVNDKMLPYFANRRVHIIKLSCSDFFKKYAKWEEEQISSGLRLSTTRTIRNSGVSSSSVSNKLQYKLNFVLKQIDKHYEGLQMSRKDFYTGSEPNYNVILKSYDVVRQNLLTEIESKVNLADTKNDLIPIVFLTGSFGTGKSTFTYRLINQYLENPEYDAIAFEIIDFNRLRNNDLIELIESIENKTIIIHCNLLERDSVFKSIVNLRTTLSSHQFDQKILFILSIRENILETFKAKRNVNNSHLINIDQKLNSDEISQLVENLRQSDLINYRDEISKKKFVDLIKNNYGGDQFISLLDLVTNGKHIEDLREAYNQLSSQCQEAFLYTALLHRFNIQMPSNLLRSLVSQDWEDFINNVINVEGKGILIQETLKSKDLDPDLYFRTKHPVIAKKIIEDVLDKRKEFKYYKKLIVSILPGDTNVRLINNLLKILRSSDHFYEAKINSLYEMAVNNLSDEPHFLLNYAINLQRKGSIEDLKKAYDTLIYAESLLERRNHRFIHRRGSICFDLCKAYFKIGDRIDATNRSLIDAKELLRVKQLYDPFSHYSYQDLLTTLIWELKNLERSKEEQLRLRIEIEDLISYSLNTITEGINRILVIKEKYNKEFVSIKNANKYEQDLLEDYSNPHFRPFVCILLYNLYFEQKELVKCKELILEMEGYLDCYEVLIFVFKYYGKNLQSPNVRIKYFDLVRRNSIIEEKQTLRFNYYSYIAEAYNWNFRRSFSHLAEITQKYNHINPEYQQYWIDSESNEPQEFEGSVFKGKRSWEFKVSSIPLTCRIRNIGSIQLKKNPKSRAKLKFHLFGIIAEVIEN